MHKGSLVFMAVMIFLTLLARKRGVYPGIFF
jgi:hypothetical protein